MLFNCITVLWFADKEHVKRLFNVQGGASIQYSVLEKQSVGNPSPQLQKLSKPKEGRAWKVDIVLGFLEHLTAPYTVT